MIFLEETTLSVLRKVNLACLLVQMTLDNLKESVESSFGNVARPTSGEAHLRGKRAQTIKDGRGIC